MQRIVVHLVARSFHPYQPFNHRLQCIWFWRNLQKLYPHVLAAILMPNHLHLVIQTNDSDKETSKLSKLAAHFTRKFYPNQNLWQPITQPEVIPDRLHLQRTIRYVHLNPCRKKWVDDPLKWEFSTHRDWLDLSYPSWISETKRKSIFQTFNPKTFHSYVSSDPTCKTEGTPLLCNLPSTSARTYTSKLDFSEIPIKWIFKSALISLHAPVSALSKKGIVRTIAIQSVLESNHFCRSRIAAELQIARQSVYEIQKKERNREAVQATLRTLGDPRMLLLPLESDKLTG